MNRDHQIADFLTRLQDQSQRLNDVYVDADGARARELQSLSTGDPFEDFYKQLAEIKDFHRRYPNEPVENLERAYRIKPSGEGEVVVSEIDNLFSGEEAYGRFLDLTGHHEQFLNLPGVRGGRRLTYLQYLDVFDVFSPPPCPVKRPDKLKDDYFQYTGSLATYLESFMRRAKPLEDLDKLFSSFDREFVEAWDADKVLGWSATETGNEGTAGPTAEGTGEGIWCPDCEKEFRNENVYKNHLTGKKHVRAAEARATRPNGTNGSSGINGHATSAASHASADARTHRLKERAVAEREFRVKRLASTMQSERSDTRVNVERRQGMTEREREQELEALYAESTAPIGQPGGEEESDGEGDDKIYNPLKLPLAWDGKPIPYWLYKLHGLGVEFTCEICGNFVYMGRRAFDKHFNEARHIYGLKCLGVTNTTLFREITGIEDAQKLWAKIQQDKKKEKASTDNIVEAEDSSGHVMPIRVFLDLQKQGLV